MWNISYHDTEKRTKPMHNRTCPAIQWSPDNSQKIRKNVRIKRAYEFTVHHVRFCVQGDCGNNAGCANKPGVIYPRALEDLGGRAWRTPPKGPDSFVLTYKIFET